jgi:hypothetical protein
MPDQTIHGIRPVFSASAALEAAGRALNEIKASDRLTWSDIGAVLGVSEDQAAKYADGTATMNFVTFGRGKREWNGRFTGYFDRLCEESRPGMESDRECEGTVLKAALALSMALADDNKITAREIRANRATIENARDALTALLGRVAVAA